jgi:CDP-diacylglycerol--glycerol-3-phosphate 3-phosphatidyltransferase
MRERIWTVSNMLSMLRVVLVIPVGYLLLHENPQYHIYALIVIVVASLTDLFDGMIARKLNQVTEFGKIIDPVADKISVACIVGILVYQEKIPLWFLLLVLARDIVIFFCGAYLKEKKGIVPMSILAGKWAVAFIAMLVAVTVLDIGSLFFLKEILIAVSTIFILYSSALYAVRFRKMVTGDNSP